MIRIVVEAANLNMREMTIIKDCTQLSLYEIRDRATNHTNMMFVNESDEQAMINAAMLVRHLQASHVTVCAFREEEELSLSFFDSFLSAPATETKLIDGMIRIYVRKAERLMMSVKIIKDVLAMPMDDIKDRLDNGIEMMVIDADDLAQMAIAAQLVSQLQEYRVPICITQNGHQISPEIFRSYLPIAESSQAENAVEVLVSEVNPLVSNHTEQKPWWKKLFHLN